MQERISQFRAALADACRAVYGERLVALALFGSWARAAATPVSDLDVLLVACPLPPSRLKRSLEFAAVEAATLAERRQIWPGSPAATELSPILKTPDEVRAGSPLFLDMTEWCDILFDRDGFFTGYLDDFRERLKTLGARRLPRKGGYCWQYRKDIRLSESVPLRRRTNWPRAISANAPTASPRSRCSWGGTPSPTWSARARRSWMWISFPRIPMTAPTRPPPMGRPGRQPRLWRRRLRTRLDSENGWRSSPGMG